MKKCSNFAVCSDTWGHPGFSARGLTVAGSWPHTNHCGVQYISRCVCKWAFPHGFGTIKPPQDMGLIEWKARGVWLSVRQRVSEKEAKQNERERDYRVWWPWQPCGRVVFTVLDFDWGKLSEPSGSPAGWGWDCSLSFFTHRDPLEMADQMGRKASGSNCWFVWTAWDGLKAENLCMCASELVCLYSRRESVSVW